MIPFAELAPDIANHNTEALKVADNVIPVANGYASINEAESMGFGMATSSVPARGGWNYRHPSIFGFGDRFIGVCDSIPKIYSNGTDITGVGLADVASADWDLWDFVEWDDDLIIIGAARIETVSASDIFSQTATSTAALGGSPPAARTGDKVRQHLVLGSTYESSTFYYSRVWWSAFGDPEGWESGTNLAGFEDLDDGGEIMRIVGGEYGLIFQTDKITRMNYLGAPSVWEFDPVENVRGTYFGHSVVQVGNDVYFYGQDGFYRLIDGQKAQPIGAGRIDNWFRDNFYGLYNKDDQKQIKGAYDAGTNSIWWFFNSKTNSTAVSDRVIIYNISIDRWSTATMDCEAAYSRRQISETVAAENRKEEFSIGIIKDDVSTASNHFRLSGDDLAAVIETGDIFDEKSRTLVQQARVFADGTWSLKLITKDDELSDTESTGSAISAEGGGNYPCDSEARYHRLQWTSSSDWSEASGFAVDQVPAGEF